MDVEKMVMNIRYDFYEFLVMLFGLCNALQHLSLSWTTSSTIS
jgi:hypothetical protein